ncbi:MAG: RnfABCDGE type electron transport complex subunit B [Brevinema sp.]
MEISVVYIGTAIAICLAIVLGIAISLITQFFYVETDSRIELIYDILPHYNCGACGYAGCKPYAEGICCGDVVTKCRPGGQKVAQLLEQFIVENPNGEHCKNILRK